MEHMYRARFPAFGPRLRTLRRARSLKQSALAEMIGVEQSTVSRWESGTLIPSSDVQDQVFQTLSVCKVDEFALKLLVESSTLPIHLIDEASHICLAYSKSRGHEWRKDPQVLLGKTLWPYASEEIQIAEEALDQTGWWDTYQPQPFQIRTAPSHNPEMRIQAGCLTYERMYLSDGTPVRLCTTQFF